MQDYLNLLILKLFVFEWFLFSKLFHMWKHIHIICSFAIQSVVHIGIIWEPFRKAYLRFQNQIFWIRICILTIATNGFICTVKFGKYHSAGVWSLNHWKMQENISVLFSKSIFKENMLRVKMKCWICNHTVSVFLLTAKWFLYQHESK